jgi:hypothetical protein
MEGYMLPANQIIAASLIAIGETKKEAAKAAKVSPQTVSGWMQSPDFIALISTIKTDILREAQDKLRGLATKAVTTIASLMEESEAEKVRLDAAKYILNTIRISPTSDDVGLWLACETTYEDVLRRQNRAVEPVIE